MIRGILGAGLVWLSVGQGPHLPLRDPVAADDMVRQASDAWRGATLKSLRDMRRELKAEHISLVWDTDGEAAQLTDRLAPAGTP